MFRLIPKEQAFFDLFEKSADNAHACALKLAEFLERFDDLDTRREHIKQLEHRGDELTHDLVTLLNKTFLTPIDREDIHELAGRLDDILDGIDTAVDRICLFKLTHPMEESKQLARVLVQATELICQMVRLMRKGGATEEMRRRVREVHRLETEADFVERQALARLFEDHPDPILVIKWKNVIEVLEGATDMCEDAANVIEGIVIKNA